MTHIEHDIDTLNNYFDELAEEWGGDIDFYPPISEAQLCELEKCIDYKLPDIFRWMYTTKTNGIKIDNKLILPIYDEKNKKTFVENVGRFNDPSKDLYFKGRPSIFKDYVIIGYEGSAIICLSKKYHVPNPLLYSCSDFNNPGGVNFYRSDLNLEGLIKKMVKETFEEDEADWVLK